MQVIIWIAAIIGTIDLLPQVVRAIKQGHTHGVSRATLALFAADKVLNLVVMLLLGVGPLAIKYVVGIACVLILIYFRIKTDKKG